MKVVISAQDYGFCPTSYAFLIAREVKALFNNVTFSLIDTGSVRIFNQNNLDLGLTIESKSDWAAVDCLISFYEPEQLFEAWLHKIPTLYYCNLLSLWLENTRLPMNQISEYILGLYVLREAKEYDAARDMLNSLKDKDVFAFQLAGYFLADKVFCRPDWEITKDIARLPKSVQEKTQVLGIPMILPAPKADHIRKNEIVFQLSGGTSPEVSAQDKEAYIRGCYTLLLAMKQEYPQYRYLFCANATQLNALNPALPSAEGVEIKPTMEQAEFQHHLADASALFVPPGLGTTYEAIHMGIPLFYLPSHHPFQMDNINRLEKNRLKMGKSNIGFDHPEQAGSFERLQNCLRAYFANPHLFMAEVNAFMQNMVPNWAQTKSDNHQALVEAYQFPQPFISSKKFFQVIMNQLFALLSPQQLSSIKFFRPARAATVSTEQVEQTEIAQP
ncbi:hypothetical protein [Legionella shakespearei]|uniref:Uncharacterized protein n=1 Tax=Legionella shakespearei DSM 23087 TaxID=1122169 RepID=A0A0W0YKH9_9GAMM|nr:hypothetical protein [Legionella shakespearei]KTD57397.1 hypothetical protein Lsha_2582 [Legionella shakespearei DSM 23087]